MNVLCMYYDNLKQNVLKSTFSTILKCCLKIKIATIYDTLD
jgi:hypothetical protein